MRNLILGMVTGIFLICSNFMIAQTYNSPITEYLSKEGIPIEIIDRKINFSDTLITVTSYGIETTDFQNWKVMEIYQEEDNKVYWSKSSDGVTVSEFRIFNEGKIERIEAIIFDPTTGVTDKYRFHVD